MRALFSAWATFAVATKRLLAQRGLALAITLGLVVIVALVVSLPIYADGVNYRMMQTALSPGATTHAMRRPPFAFMFRYIGSWHGPLNWPDVEAVDSYLSGPVTTVLGLPSKAFVRHFSTDKLQLFPQDQIAYADVRKPLEWVSLGTISDLEPNIVLVEGQFPAVAPFTADSTVEVLISEKLATKLGMQAGETYVLLDRSRTLNRNAPLQIPVRIAGIWTAKDPGADFWFYRPEALEDMLLVPEETYRGRIGNYAENEVYVGLWYHVLDGSTVQASDVPWLVARIIRAKQEATNLLKNVQLDISPLEALQRYQRATFVLSILLYAFSVPILGLVLAFILLVTGLAVERQRNEIAVFRSRGATAAQVLGINSVEGLVLGALALALGVPLSLQLASLIGRAHSFLDFSAATDLRITVTRSALWLGLVLLGLAILAQIVPAVGAARHTITTYKQERARMLRPPWWQRAWLDVMLLIPAVYGAYVLRGQGSIVLPGVDNQLPNDPFQNPLLFLVPALGIFAVTLFLLRLLPALMSAVAWLAGRLGSVGVLLTARHLARSPGSYSGPLVLLVVTLSLSTYTASLAATLDDHAYDQIYYRIGADMRVVEMSAVDRGGMFGGADTATGGATGGGPTGGGVEFEFLPVNDHLKAPGVLAATRVARYAAQISGDTRRSKATFIGVDRVDFPAVAFWRHDFAPASLGALMNALAVSHNAVLVSRDFLVEQRLGVGDTLRLAVTVPGRQAELNLKVTGYFTLFPSWYPEDGPLFIGNLEHLFDYAGGQIPYDVWLKTDPALTSEEIVQGIREVGFRILTYDHAGEQVRAELERPERQGLFGFLSVGFGAAAFLTVLGFLLYALFSFRRRFIELGVLRAIGLSVSQMTLLLASELAILILIGLVVGTILGASVSELFIPHLQVGEGAAAYTPPYLVAIGWPTVIRLYVILGALFVVTLGLLGGMLLRMRIFQAVKLGEAA